jgi:hypothetical protein
MLGSDASERIKVCRDGGAELRWIELVTVIAGVILCLAGLVLTVRPLGRRHGLTHQQACPPRLCKICDRDTKWSTPVRTRLGEPPQDSHDSLPVGTKGLSRLAT